MTTSSMLLHEPIANLAYGRLHRAIVALRSGWQRPTNLPRNGSSFSSPS